MKADNVIVVVGKTRLEQLVERFNTRSQARFYIEHAGGDFDQYESEHAMFVESLDKVVSTVGRQTKYKVIDRSYLPNFLFSDKDTIVVVGQDGLVANTAKYVRNLPILAVNPDPANYDGILLPFTVRTFQRGLRQVMEDQYTSRQVTMAFAKTNDGQQLMAFNDLFIGPATHTSARYKITFNGQTEIQSSSGLIVSTGAGSTGWLSSVLNMSNGIQDAFQSSASPVRLSMKWEDNRLAFVVREPFLSRHSQIGICAGILKQPGKLVIESLMPYQGVIFSDGVEQDYLKFNTGCIAEISIAAQKANIVQ